MKKFWILKFIIIAIIIATVACVIISCTNNDNNNSTDTNDDTQQTSTNKSEPVTVSLIAVGDNLLHSTILNDAKTSNGGYDFMPIYAPVAQYIKDSDLAFVNQEAPLAGSGYQASGYPLFNSPQQAGLDLVSTGFNVINMANNHALDKGAQAVINTADFWDSVEGVAMLGIARSQDEASEIKTVEVNGVTFAFLSYCYGTNGMPMEYSYLLSLIDMDKTADDVTRAKEISDCVIVSMHWGNEYQLTPSAIQREMAQQLADMGVDLVIGHHPHVIEPAEWLTGKNGNRTFVAYSLGNFVSSQHERETMLGGMLSVKFVCQEGKVSISEAGIIPLVTHYEHGLHGYRVYRLSDYTDELAARHGISDYDKPVSVKYFEDLSAQVFGQYRIY